MTDEWVPFGLDEEAERDYRTLIGGVPGHLRESLVQWLVARVQAGGSWSKSAPLMEVQRRTGIHLPGTATENLLPTSRVATALRNLDDLPLLQVIDAFLSYSSLGAAPPASLNMMLREGRSRYEVGNRGGHLGLVDRVEPGVRDYVEGVISAHETPGKLLARAWYHVHALEPNDTMAYADAVRAVETAAAPVVEPNNREATLGSIVSAIRTQGDWALAIREHEHAPSADMVVMMCRNLYRGHRDRHGHPDYSDVTHEEALIAVSIAAALVDWFASGRLRRTGAPSA